MKFHNQDGLLLYKGKLLLDSTSQLIQLVLKECHLTPMGHRGIHKMMAKVYAAFTWEGLRKDAQQFVQECDICQQVKYSNKVPASLLQPLPVPQQVWEDLAMDFITGLPLLEGYSTILVVIDRFSKQAHFSALPRNYSAPRVSQLFSTVVYKLHGISRSIVSDHDAIFMSKFWIELFVLSGTLLKRSIAYHPQTDG